MRARGLRSGGRPTIDSELVFVEKRPTDERILVNQHIKTSGATIGPPKIILE